MSSNSPYYIHMMCVMPPCTTYILDSLWLLTAMPHSHPFAENQAALHQPPSCSSNVCAYLYEELVAVDHLCHHDWQPLATTAAAGCLAIVVLLPWHHVVLRVPVLPHLGTSMKVSHVATPNISKHQQQALCLDNELPLLPGPTRRMRCDTVLNPLHEPEHPTPEHPL